MPTMPAEDAELQILRAAKALLDTIPGAFCRGVDLNRTFAVSEPSELPRLILIYGEDEVVEDGLTYSDNLMELVVRAVVHDQDDLITTQLSALRREVHSRLATDRELGRPDLVIDVIPAGATRPDMPDRELGLPVVFRDFNFQVRYRTNVADRTQGGAGPAV